MWLKIYKEQARINIGEIDEDWKLFNKEVLDLFSLIRLIFQNVPRLALQHFAYLIYDFQ